MAIEQCKECGGKLSTKANACPHCGAKIYRWGWGKKLIAGFVILWGVAFVVGIANQSPGENQAVKESMDAARAQNTCERAIEVQLKAPSTATFSGMLDTRVGKSEKGDWIVHGHVDAQNGYGAMIRNRFQCRITPGADEWTVASAKLLE